MNNPQDQIYIKRITRKERMREAITVFVTLSIVLLSIYGILKYMEKQHEGRMSEIMSGKLFNVEIDGNEGSIRIAGEFTKYIFSNNAKDQYDHQIEHLNGNIYLMTYKNKLMPGGQRAQLFHCFDKTITYDPPEEYIIEGGYLNLTKQDAQRILDATKAN